VGRRFLRSALPLYGGLVTAWYVEAIEQQRCSGHIALAYGTLLGEMGIECSVALLSYTNNFVMGQAAAAVKLLNLGQSRTQQLIAAMQATIELTVDHALHCGLDDCQSFTPLLDIRAMQHEYLFRRLFIS
jgi:urease accessory protein